MNRTRPVPPIKPTPLYAAIAALILVPACDNSDAAQRSSAPPDAVPERITVQGGSVELGTKLGALRKRVTLGAFQIAKLPVTVSEYHRCVEAGACAVPSATWQSCKGPASGVDGPTYGADTLGSESLPITCATPEQATQFCSWVGGSLPRLDQFYLAARGPEIRRFAWGDEPPNCERHFRQSFDHAAEDACCGHDCASLEVPALPGPEQGASPSGLLAVLAAQGEMLRADAAPGTSACGIGARSCVATGQLPGALDVIVPVPVKPENDSAAWHLPPSGFRCVWEVKS